MKSALVNISALLFFMVLPLTGFAQQQPQEPDIMEQIENEADRLQRVLGLEDWQVFYVDSTLKHDYPAMREEITQLSQAKVSNADMYMRVQDKWMEQIDATYKRIFTDEQWVAYLKQGAAKLQKAREKRRLKAQGK